MRLVFDDGHDTGLFTWKYLHELGTQREQKWSEYLARVRARATRDRAESWIARCAAGAHERWFSVAQKERPGD